MLISPDILEMIIFNSSPVFTSEKVMWTWMFTVVLRLFLLHWYGEPAASEVAASPLLGRGVDAKHTQLQSPPLPGREDAEASEVSSSSNQDPSAYQLEKRKKQD